MTGRRANYRRQGSASPKMLPPSDLVSALPLTAPEPPEASQGYWEGGIQVSPPISGLREPHTCPHRTDEPVPTYSGDGGCSQKDHHPERSPCQPEGQSHEGRPRETHWPMAQHTAVPAGGAGAQQTQEKGRRTLLSRGHPVGSLTTTGSHEKTWRTVPAVPVATRGCVPKFRSSDQDPPSAALQRG